MGNVECRRLARHRIQCLRRSRPARCSYRKSLAHQNRCGVMEQKLSPRLAAFMRRTIPRLSKCTRDPWRKFWNLCVKLPDEGLGPHRQRFAMRGEWIEIDINWQSRYVVMGFASGGLFDLLRWLCRFLGPSEQSVLMQWARPPMRIGMSLAALALNGGDGHGPWRDSGRRAGRHPAINRSGVCCLARYRESS